MLYATLQFVDILFIKIYTDVEKETRSKTGEKYTLMASSPKEGYSNRNCIFCESEGEWGVDTRFGSEHQYRSVVWTLVYRAHIFGLF